MVSSQLFALIAILLACLLCTSCSSYTLFRSATCPKHAIRTCMSKVPAVSSPSYCKEARAAIECAMHVVGMCPDNAELLVEMINYNPIGLYSRVDMICRTRESQD